MIKTSNGIKNMEKIVINSWNNLQKGNFSTKSDLRATEAAADFYLTPRMETFDDGSVTFFDINILPIICYLN